QTVQGKAHLPEEGAAAGQDAVFGLVEKAPVNQLPQVAGAEMAQRHPADGLDVPQSAGRALDVGLEVVFGVIELGMAGLLLGPLGAEELGAGPHVLLVQSLDHLLAQLFLPDQDTGLHQVGDDGDIRAGLVLAFADTAYTVTDFQADIPEQGKEAADCLVILLAAAALTQRDEQVDVRVRVQLAAAVAADRQQGDIRLQRTVECGPGLAENLIVQPGAVVDQLVNVTLALEACLKHGIGVPEGFLEGPGGIPGGGQIAAELARVKEFVVHVASSGPGPGVRF